MSEETLDNLIELESVLNTLGGRVKKIIMDRTRAGVDVDGNSFIPYSKQYAKRRAAKGDFAVTPVILRSTTNTQEAMMSLDNIVDEINGSLSQVEVFMQYPAKEQLAYYHHISGAGKNRRIRKFFDLSDTEVEELVDLANEKIIGPTKEVTAERLVSLLKKLEVKTVT